MYVYDLYSSYVYLLAKSYVVISYLVSLHLTQGNTKILFWVVGKGAQQGLPFMKLWKWAKLYPKLGKSTPILKKVGL